MAGINGEQSTQYRLASDPANNPGKGSVGRFIAAGIDKLKSFGRGSQPELPAAEPVFNVELPTVKRNVGGVGVYGTDPAPDPTMLPSHSAPVDFTTAPAGSSTLPPKINGFTNTVNPDGSGILTPLKKRVGGIKRAATPISQPDEEGLRTAPVVPPTDAPVVAGYGEISGDPSTRLYAQAADPVTTSTTVAPAATAPVDMSPGSQGEWAANQTMQNRLKAVTPDLNNMSIADLIGFKQGLKALNVTSEANYRNAAANNFGEEIGLKRAELPSTIAQKLASANSLNTGATVTAFKAIPEVNKLNAETGGIITRSNIEQLKAPYEVGKLEAEIGGIKQATTRSATMLPVDVKEGESKVNLNNAHALYFGNQPDKSDIAKQHDLTRIETAGTTAYNKYLEAHPGDVTGATSAGEGAKKLAAGEILLAAPIPAVPEKKGKVFGLFGGAPAKAEVPGVYGKKGVKVAADSLMKYRAAREAANGDATKIALIDAQFEKEHPGVK